MLSSAISYASCEEKKKGMEDRGGREGGGGRMWKREKGSESGNGGEYRSGESVDCSGTGRSLHGRWGGDKEGTKGGMLHGADFLGDVDVSRCGSGSREGRFPCTHSLQRG